MSPRDKMGSLAGRLKISNQGVRIMLAEFLGTLLLVVLGDGAVAQMVLSKRANGTFLSVNLAYGFAVTFGVYVCVGVSGGHINPAVTLAFCMCSTTKWLLLPFYWIGQYLGGFFGAGIVYAVYRDALLDYNPVSYQVTGPNATAGIFATYPAAYLSTGGGLLDQVVGTAILLACLLSFLDQRNTAVPMHLVPLLVGFVIMVLGMSFGVNCGYALNPARDFGPRLLTLAAGWGGETFSAFNYWFWVPIVGPYTGAVVGCMIYILFVRLHWPTSEPALHSTAEVVGTTRKDAKAV